MQEQGIGGSGYDMEELSAYLDRGEQPRIAAIDDNAECQAVLASMRHWSGLSRELVHRDAAGLERDESFFESIMGRIAVEVRAGRDIEFASPRPGTRLVVTEGAIRELLRGTGDGVTGALVLGCRLAWREDDTVLDADVSLSVRGGMAIAPVAAEVRTALAMAIARHTPAAPGTIDIRVEDVHVLKEEQDD
jgi:hypothetical protein